MSEKSLGDQYCSLMQEALTKLEEDRKILTGSAFRKWHSSPIGSYLAILVCLAVFYMIIGIRDDETMPFTILLPFILLSTMINFAQSQGVHVMIVGRKKPSR